MNNFLLLRIVSKYDTQNILTRETFPLSIGHYSELMSGKYDKLEVQGPTLSPLLWRALEGPTDPHGGPFRSPPSHRVQKWH